MTKGTRLATVLALFAAMLATLTSTQVAPAAAATPPIGYYEKDASPAYGSTVTTTDFSFDVPLALAPDRNEFPTIDWGDGEKDPGSVYCKLFKDGTEASQEDCYEVLGLIEIPLGAYWIRGSHTYHQAGTFTAKLTYRSFYVPHSTSWTVVSTGLPVEFYLDYDPTKTTIAITPEPTQLGAARHPDYNNRTLHKFSTTGYSLISVKATPLRSGASVKFIQVACDYRCYRDGGTEYLRESAMCADRTNDCNYNIPSQPSIYDGENGQVGTKVVRINVTAPADTTPPTITSSLNPATPDGENGWYRSDVALGWSVAEPESAETITKTGCADQRVTTDQQSASYTCSATSEGGTAAQQSVSVKRDASAPVVLGKLPATGVAVGGATWHKDQARIDWSATDATSGLRAGSLTPTTSTLGEGWNQSASAAALDQAGNRGTATLNGINVDATAPTVNAAIVSKPAHGDDWYRDDVQVAVTASDPALADGHAGSGLKTDPTGTHTRTSSGSYTAVAVDQVGYSSSAAKLDYRVDSVAPAVSLICPSGPVVKGRAAVASWLATDAGDSAGLRTPSSGTVALNTESIGTRTAVAPLAWDNVGHSSSTPATCDYTVIYQWTSFLEPITPGVLNTAKAGSAIPVKFTLGGDQGLNVLNGTPTAQAIPCLAGAPTDAVEEVSDAASNGLRYDAASGQYVYTWKTPRTAANSCQRLSLRLADGTTHTADFKLT